MAPAKPNDFQAFIHNARERKKNEDLATKLLSSKSRRQSAPNLRAGGSLASRVGVNKKRSSLAGRAGESGADWTYDLQGANGKSAASRTALGGRITAPGAAPTGPKNTSRRAERRAAAALDRTSADQFNVRAAAAVAPAATTGISIRGLAGPYVVMAQNFAPGTTAADVESAMTPVGGEMESCHIVKTSPFIIVEMAFASREGGERVINTFNNKTADGRIIKVYPKIGNHRSAAAAASTPAQAPPAQVTGHIVDGSMGFPEPVTNQLYSDVLVGNNSSNNNNNNNGGGSGRRGRGGRGRAR